MNSVTTNGYDQGTWDKAQVDAARLGKIPNVFAAAVRLLIADHANFGGTLRPVTKYLVSHAFRGKKIMSMMYYSTRAFLPEEVANKEHVTIGEMVNLYKPYDVAVIYALYLILSTFSCAQQYDQD